MRKERFPGRATRSPKANVGQAKKPIEELERVAIRFAGDSGDGIQLTGTKFTESTALAGNDLSTFPDFPAEIRAPAGSLAGVSGFQIHFAGDDIRTPADQPDVLVAFNPAALRANVEDVRPNGMLIVNSDAFVAKNIERAGYTEEPLPELRDRFRLVEIPITSLNARGAAGPLKLGAREADRSKNFFALGMMYWLYNRRPRAHLRWIEGALQGNGARGEPEGAEGRLSTSARRPNSSRSPSACRRPRSSPGTYRNITGNTALAWGIVAAGVQMERSRSSSAPIRSRRPPTYCTSWRATATSA